MCEYINDTIIQENFRMEKAIYDESNSLWYELGDDYYIPYLTVPAQEEMPSAFGRSDTYGSLRRRARLCTQSC